MQIEITSDTAGKTIKKLLFGPLSFSRAAVTALKTREDGILVNGEHRTVRYVLQEGDTLVLNTLDATPSPRIRESAGPLDILYEDEAILALNKPPHMALHPSKKLQDDTLAGRVLYHRYPMVFRAAGRLDKDTSGVVLCAKSRVVAGQFFHLIRARALEKEYLLLCESEKTPPSQGEIALCIRRDPQSYITRVCFPADGTEKESERALTRFRLIKSRGNYHLFCAAPVTGRTHQIRAHFSAIGFPLVGDTLYGAPSPLIDRQALHAFTLTFPHPQTGQTMCVRAPLPDDFKTAIRTAFGDDFDAEAIIFSKARVERTNV